MKVIYRAMCAALALIIALFAAGCANVDKNDGVVVDIYTPQPQVIVPVPTVVGGTVAPDVSSTPQISAPPDVTASPVPTEPDYTVFDDAAFLGNSTFEGLYRYGIITHGTFYTKVGLNVLTVHTATTTTGTVPIIDELNNGTYAKVLLMFGENELGWPSPSTFIEKYSELLDAVWQRQPNAEIYIVAMPPVSASVSSTSTTGVTNDNIQNFNAMLKDLAVRRGCGYISVPKELYTFDGVLPAEASSDGIHLNLQYARYWADHICLTVMGVIDE